MQTLNEKVILQDQYQILGLSLIVRFDSEDNRMLFKKRYGGFYVKDGISKALDTNVVSITDSNGGLRDGLKLDMHGEVTIHSDIYRLFSYMEIQIGRFLTPELFNYERFHSAAVYCSADKGIMLLAPSGCGKTTLATRLTENGFRFLSDDVTVIDRKTLEVIPFPRAVKILRADKEPLFINIEEIYPSSIGIRCTLQYLIFVEPYYETKGKTVTLKQVSKSEAFKGLFKFHVADKTTDLNKSLNTISSLVNMSECYRLIPGKLEDVISSIIDLAKTGR